MGLWHSQRMRVELTRFELLNALSRILYLSATRDVDSRPPPPPPCRHFRHASPKDMHPSNAWQVRT